MPTDETREQTEMQKREERILLRIESLQAERDRYRDAMWDLYSAAHTAVALFDADDPVAARGELSRALATEPPKTAEKP